MFITFEGPDGSGKSTIVELIYLALKEKRYDIVKTREPGGTPISEKLRDIILDKENKELSCRTEALLYAAARAQHVEEFIKPNLEKGKIVISDRYVISSLAYQGVGRGLGIEKIAEINKFATDDLQPDLVFFFKVNPLTTLKRKSALDIADRMELEKEEFHLRVYSGYMDIYERNKSNPCFIGIDAEKSIDEVFRECMLVITSKLRRIS